METQSVSEALQRSRRPHPGRPPVLRQGLGASTPSYGRRPHPGRRRRITAFHANLLRHYSHLYPDQHNSQLARYCRSSHTRRAFLREREQTLFRRP
ncbi:MAG TPA: hypothetical protein DDX19_04345 [Rhodopirellula baltica]|nr:hypothetical protein [Rhodopirellula baltica]